MPALIAILLVGLVAAGAARAGDAPAPSPPEAVEEAATPSDLTDTLQSESGVVVQTMCTNCNNADLSLGGLGNDHVTVLCDGMPVAPGLAQIYLLSVMPATMIDRVAVQRGAGASAIEGSAVGGVIEIERRRPATGMTLNASADAGTFDWQGAKVDLSGRKGRFGGLFAASHATSDAVDANEDRFADLPAFDRYTIEAVGEVELGRDRALRLGATTYDESQKDGPGAADVLFFDPQTGQFNQFRGYDRENVELSRQQVDARFQNPFADGSRLEVTAGWSDRSQDIHETEHQNGIFQPTYLIDQQLERGSASWWRPIGQRASIRAGASVTRDGYDVVDRYYNRDQIAAGLLSPDEEFANAFEEAVTEQGLWVEGQRTLGGSTELSGGLRYVDFKYQDDEDRAGWTELPLPEGSRLLPRASLAFKPADAVQLRFSAGAGLRAARPIHSEVCCGRRYRNNRGVELERSRSLGMETIYQARPRLRLGASVFVTDFDNLAITMITRAASLRPTYQNVNVADARYTTASLEARIEPTRWLTASLAASWLDADNRSADDTIVALVDSGVVLPGFPSGPEPRTFQTDEIPYVARRSGAARFQLRPWRRAGIDLVAQYTGPMRIQQYGGAIEFVETDDFWVANAQLTQALGRGISLYAGIDNAFDYVQSDLDDPTRDYNWGPLRGRYVYGGISYGFSRD